MANPVLVEVSRGNLVESAHRGAIAVVDADGSTVTEIGDIDHPVFPRSAIKALQALPLVESGAAEALGLEDRHIALACSSHNAERAHVETARDMLRAAGLDETAYECGIQWPRHLSDQKDLITTDQDPGRIHNNCSGKHAGFLCLACHLGYEHRGYVRSDHAVQMEIAGVLEEMTRERHHADNRGIDGCSIPTYAIPLKSAALAFAKFATGNGLGPERQKAAKRIQTACANEPFMVAGTGRFCTDIMTVMGARAFVKTGAEGVFCAAFPELGYGVALKIDDGATRGSEAVMAALISRFLPLSDAEKAAVDAYLNPPILDRNGRHVGRIAPVLPAI